MNISHIAKLANLPITKKSAEELARQLDVTVTYVSKLQELDTKNIGETSQVTGAENVFREDIIDGTRILSQKETLANAKRTENGFFVVDAVFTQE